MSKSHLIFDIDSPGSIISNYRFALKYSAISRSRRNVLLRIAERYLKEYENVRLFMMNEQKKSTSNLLDHFRKRRHVSELKSKLNGLKNVVLDWISRTLNVFSNTYSHDSSRSREIIL